LPVEPRFQNILLAGPAGVGKTEVGAALAARVMMTHIDWDEWRLRFKDRPEFQRSSLNLMACLPTLRMAAPRGFILDMGVGTLFHQGRDNPARVEDMQHFKVAGKVGIVLITASREVVFRRHMQVKNSSALAFPGDWDQWEKHELPYWQRSADLTIEASGLDAAGIAERIAGIVRAASSS